MLNVNVETTILFTVSTWVTLVLVLTVALILDDSDPANHPRFCGVKGFYSCFADHGPHLFILGV